METGSELGQLAFDWWGQHGIRVFPCASNKKPLTPHGFKDALTGEAEIISLFSSYGEKAVFIGGEMGDYAGLFCLDLDLYRQEAKDYKKILKAAGHLPPTRVHKTKGGGEHHIFFTPENAQVVVGIIIVSFQSLHVSAIFRDRSQHDPGFNLFSVIETFKTGNVIGPEMTFPKRVQITV